MPYNALGKTQYPALLADINRSHVAFSVFDGDLKAGGDGPCSDSLYTTALDNFNTLDRPLIFVPGDNDWTDWGTSPAPKPLRAQHALGERPHRPGRPEPVRVRAAECSRQRSVAALFRSGRLPAALPRNGSLAQARARTPGGVKA
jgi:hypothetical protein